MRRKTFSFDKIVLATYSIITQIVQTPRLKVSSPPNCKISCRLQKDVSAHVFEHDLSKNRCVSTAKISLTTQFHLEN